MSEKQPKSPITPHTPEVRTVADVPEIDQIWQASKDALITDLNSLTAGITLPRLANPNAAAFLGIQGGDEAKATWVNRFSRVREQGVGVRIGGGSNAGHVRIPEGFDKEETNRMLPVTDGDGWTKVVGRAVLARPDLVVNEIHRLGERGNDNSPKKVMVDGMTFLAWDAHVERDIAQEMQRGEKAVGTTKSGVGPAAEDYAGRSGMRFGDLRLSPHELKDRVTEEVERNNRILKALNSQVQYDPDDVYQKMLMLSEILGPYIQNTLPIVKGALENGGNFAAEGAQAFRLGRDTGIPGSVTSTNCGLNTLELNYVTSRDKVGHRIGVAKLVPTLVGNHVIHSPLSEEDQEVMYNRTAERGLPEEGAVSKRKRLYSDLNMPELLAAIETYGINAVVLSKMDAVDNKRKIRIGMEYVFPDGERSRRYDPGDSRMRDSRTYVNSLEMDGWMQDTAGMTDLRDAPHQMLAVVRTVSHLAGVPVVAIGTGPHFEEYAATQGSIFRRK